MEAREPKGNLKESLKKLQATLKFFEKDSDPQGIKFLAVAKGFEIAMEYSWKELKRMAEEEGYEVVSPKDAIRKAAKAKLILDAESWLGFLQARNSGVHDYFGMTEEGYLKSIRSFLKETRKIFK